MRREVCFVVLNYNDSDTTIRLVDSLNKWEAKEIHYQIIIVDNKSQDDSYEKMQRHFAGIKKTKENLVMPLAGYP